MGYQPKRDFCNLEKTHFKIKTKLPSERNVCVPQWWGAISWKRVRLFKSRLTFQQVSSKQATGHATISAAETSSHCINITASTKQPLDRSSLGAGEYFSSTKWNCFNRKNRQKLDPKNPAWYTKLGYIHPNSHSAFSLNSCCPVNSHAPHCNRACNHFSLCPRSKGSLIKTTPFWEVFSEQNYFIKTFSAISSTTAQNHLLRCAYSAI